MKAPASAPDPTARRARLGTGAVFLANGVVFGSWVPRIPEFQRALGLDEALLGAVLLAAAAGAIVAMSAAGVACGRLGSRPVSGLTMAVLALCLPALALAPTALGLAAGLFVFGGAFGAVDVAMNVQASAVERAYGRPIMSAFHGVFSLGGMAGALSSGGIAALGVGVLPHFALAGLLAGGLGLAGVRVMLAPAAEGGGAGEGGHAFVWPNRAVLPLGVMAFAVLLAEGAVADWSAVYMTGVLAAGPATAAAAYAAFSLLMAAGRFLGDDVAGRLGRPATLRLGALLAGGGLALGTVSAEPSVAVVGFALTGAGLSALFPLLLSAAPRATGLPPGMAIAAVSTCGYFGFLIGPPGIGFLADRIGLGGALVAVAGLMALPLALGGRTRPRPAVGRAARAGA